MKLKCFKTDFPFSVNEVQYISSLTSVFIFHLNSWQCSLKNLRAQHESAVKPVWRSWMLSLPNTGQDLFEVEPWLYQQLPKRKTNKGFYVRLLSLLNWCYTCSICMAGQRGNLLQSRRILTQTSHPNSKHKKPRDKIKQKKCLHIQLSSKPKKKKNIYRWQYRNSKSDLWMGALNAITKKSMTKPDYSLLILKKVWHHEIYSE